MSEYTDALTLLSQEDETLIKSEAEQRKKEYEDLIVKAEQTAKNTARSAQIDYTTYINPYGKQAETLAQAGLGASSLSETNRAKAYNAYQNRLSEAGETRTNEISAINDDITNLSLETDKNLLESKVALVKQQLEDYWKNLEWEYEKERDALEDARYDQEWAYKTSEASSGSGGSSSSSKSSSATASAASSTDTTADLTLLSNVGRFVKEGAVRNEQDIKAYISEAEAYGTLEELPNYYPQLEMLLSMAANSGATEEELKTIVKKWQKN